MRKTVYVIGTGMNSVTEAARHAVEDSDMLIGAPRMLKMFAGLKKPAVNAYKPDEVAKVIAENDASRFSVLMSGDVGFFSGAKALREALPQYELKFIAGVSSVCDFCAKLGIPWQDAVLLSAHGVEVNVADQVRRNRHVFCLTGGNTVQIGNELCGAGFGELTVYTGERLGYPDEKITKIKASELSGEYDVLTVLLVENKEYDARIRFGIPDDEFLRAGNIPMTKSEVRAVTMSKLGLSPSDICYDIGAGTGSVSVEMALAAHMGKVYSIEKNETAIKLLEENRRKFHLGNIISVNGMAPDAFDELPIPDAVFIGGSSGRISDIVKKLLGKNPNVRIVINAVALESVSGAINALNGAGFSDIEITQVSAARAENTAGLHMLKGQNPVMIISGKSK